MDIFWALPPVSRTITAGAVIISSLGHTNIIDLSDYVYWQQMIFTMKTVPQIWRLVTPFLITKPKFSILLDPYFLYQYGSGLETQSSRFSQPGDFFVYTVFIMAVVTLLAGYFLQAAVFLQALSLAFAYTYAQDNPLRQVSFFIINFDAKYLPFAMLFLTFIIESPNAALIQSTGLVAAHLFDFLTRIWPTFGGGRNYIYTPNTVKRWFGAAPGAAQTRGYGTAYQGRGNAPDPSTARTSGFTPRGPGRRLGD